MLAISAILVAFFTFLGLHTWRKQLKGKSEYEKAKEVLKAVYTVRDAFNYVRNNFIFSYEYPEEMLDSSGYLKNGFKYEGNLHVYNKRLELLNEAFLELEEKHLDAQIEWGSEFQDVIKPLRECRGELLSAIRLYLEDLKQNTNITTSPEDKMDILKKVFFQEADSEHGDFTKKINDAVDKFYSRLQPFIAKQNIISRIISKTFSKIQNILI